MKLELLWSKNGEEFILGVLEKENEEYVFKLDETGLKSAVRKGCVGIGNFDLMRLEYRSKELFPFFQNRIPSRNNINIQEILKEFNMNEYDEMQLLKYTEAEKATDNYYMKEV